jgi:hypothetical protein
MSLSLDLSFVNCAPSDDIRQKLLVWAQSHRRDRIFAKEEKIPTRPGLIYFVETGVVRLEGTPDRECLPLSPIDAAEETDLGMFLGLVAAGKPFYWESSRSMILHAYAHLEPTQVFWLYWSELSQWEGLGDFIGRSILQQHQHYLAWLSLFGQKRAIDRLLGFLVLLTQEYGIPAPEGLYFPYPLTHAQMGRAIGATRVTVTRLIGRLRAKGVIVLHQDHFICLPFLAQETSTTPNPELASH